MRVIHSKIDKWVRESVLNETLELIENSASGKVILLEINEIVKPKYGDDKELRVNLITSIEEDEYEQIK